MIQREVLTVSVVLMGLLAILFAWVATSARGLATDYGPIVSSAYRLRSWLFGIAAIILIAANYRTLGELPYPSSLPPPAGAIQTVHVTGQQWSWTIVPDRFVVGQTAEFHVTGADVNHGFGLYGPDMRIVAETQAMPGFTNVLRYTFTRPGTYHVLCLEYCGLGHHDMNTQIVVAAH
jgi:cytochrome c oxidase subunit II